MAVAFNRGIATSNGATRVLIYTCPANTTAIVFAGTFSNIDTAQGDTHELTLEIKVGSSYIPKLTDVPIVYGGSLTCPKMILFAGDQVYMKADGTKIQAVIEVVERS
jgi:hypothetical protein